MVRPESVVQKPPGKREQLEHLLERGSVFLHLDPRRVGVAVPPWLARRPQLVLQLGYNFPIPIPDLEIDVEGVRCTLSFNRSPFHCVVPWAAVYALVAEDGQMNVWSEDLPAEILPPPEADRPPMERRARTSAAPAAMPAPRSARAYDRTSDDPITDVLRRKPALAPEDIGTADSSGPNSASPEGVEPARPSTPPAQPSRRPSRLPPHRPSSPPRERPPYLRVVK